MNNSEYKWLCRGVFRIQPKIYEEAFFSYKKFVKISGNSIKFLKEKISVATEMSKIGNQFKSPRVAGATDGTQHTENARTLEWTQGPRTLKGPYHWGTSRGPCHWGS